MTGLIKGACKRYLFSIFHKNCVELVLHSLKYLVEFIHRNHLVWYFLCGNVFNYKFNYLRAIGLYKLVIFFLSEL